MGKKITFYNEAVNKIIINNGNMYRYELRSGRINKDFKIEELLDNKLFLSRIIGSGFDSYEKKFEGQDKTVWENGAITFSKRYKKFYIPISQNFIEYYQLNWSNDSWNEEYITLSNTHLNEKNVDSFYEFSLELVINDYRTTFQRSFAFEDMIYIDVPKDEVLKSTMTKLFGEPKNIPELSNEKYDCGKNDFFYIVPKSQIDKIIGIKKHRDISTIGQLDGEQFTGEQEEFVLDLQNFDKNIYKIFKEHGMLEIEGYLKINDNE